MTRWRRRLDRRWHRAALAALLLGARGDGCAFSIGPEGLCASLRLNPDRSTLRVGESLRIQINPDACSAAAGCTCTESTLDDARWRSSAPATADVDATGTVVARQAGAVDIYLVPPSGSGWARARARITVVP